VASAQVCVAIFKNEKKEKMKKLATKRAQDKE
jgi:hypothetical protein